MKSFRRQWQKVVKPSQRKQMAQLVTAKRCVSVRLVCKIFKISYNCYRHEPRFKSDNALIARHLIDLTERNKDWGFGLCFAWLRNLKGYGYNHKRVYRIYCELALNLRIKPRRRIKRAVPQALKEPVRANQIWSMDFMHDQLSNGKGFRLFNVIDDFKPEALAIEAGLSLASSRVIRTLNQLLEHRAKPEIIRCDNGPEFISKELTQWAKNRNIRLEYIQPGKPQQNTYIERYNRTVRNSLLNYYLFSSIDEVEICTTKWLWFYNHERPHMANNGKPPLLTI